MKTIEQLSDYLPAGDIIVPVMFEADDNLSEIMGIDPQGHAGFLIVNAYQIVSYNESSPNTTVRMSDGSLITVYMDILNFMDAIAIAKEVVNVNMGIN